jgi:hypothetical protein
VRSLPFLLPCTIALIALPLHADAATLIKPPNNLGLVGYWSFNEGSSTRATDFSGNGNTGTTTSPGIPTWTSGKRGAALDFDGTDDYVGVASSTSLSPTSAVTIAARVYARDWNDTGKIVCKKNVSDLLPDYCLTTTQTGGAHLRVMVTGTDGLFLSDFTDIAVPSTSAWHHIVATFDSSATSVYVDGVYQGGETPNAGAIRTNGGVLNIGSTDFAVNGALDGFNGKIDEVRVYNRALTASEVARLYQSGAVKINASSADLDNGSSLEKGLIAQWTFDGPDLTDKVYDRSGQGNNGYFVNAGGSTSTSKVQGKLGQAVAFSGVIDANNYIDIP